MMDETKCTFETTKEGKKINTSKPEDKESCKEIFKEQGIDVLDE